MGRRALPLMPYLINNLANEETVSVSSFASYVIDHLGDAAVEPLITALQIREYKGQKRALILDLLGRIGDRRAVPALIGALNDADAEVRNQAAYGLYAIPDQRAFDSLMQHLHDPNDRVAGLAARALGRVGDRRAVEPLVAALVESRKQGEKSAGMATAAAEALGDLGDRRASKALLAACQDEEWPSKNNPDRFLRGTALLARWDASRIREPLIF